MGGRHGSRRPSPLTDARGTPPRRSRPKPCPARNRRRASFEAPHNSFPDSSASVPRAPPDPPSPSPAQEHGVAASDIKKLVEAGVHTVEGLAHASKKALKDIKGLSEMKVEKLKAAGASRATPNLGTPGLTL